MGESSEAEPAQYAGMFGGVLFAAIMLTVLIGWLKARFPKVANTDSALTAVMAIAMLQFMGFDFFETVETFQAFVSESSWALLDDAKARALGASLEVTDERIGVATGFVAEHIPFAAAPLAAVAASCAAVRAAIVAAGLALLLQGRRFIGEVIVGASFVIALGALSVDGWRGPLWLRAKLGPNLATDATSAVGAALVAALAVRAFWQHSTTAWGAAVGWVAVNLAAGMTLALFAHAAELLGLADLNLATVTLANPLNSASWDALAARAAELPWRMVLWPSATDVVVALSAFLAGYACLIRGHAALRTLEDRTIRRVVPDGVFQLLVPSRVLAPLYTGVTFCAFTHVATQHATLRPVAFLQRHAGPALRPATPTAHELVLAATPVGALAAAFFQAGVAVHAFETAHYARGKMECWITALAGATLVLAALLPAAAPAVAPLPATGEPAHTARYPAFFWVWLLLVRFGITHQLQNAAAGGDHEGGGGDGGGGGGGGGAKPDTTKDEDVARALAATYEDELSDGADGADGVRAGVFGWHDSDDENESKSPVTPPSGAMSRGRTMGASGGMRNRRRSKTPVRR